ncbi:MAG: TolC family protein [Proteobacteria bacterium]|nr:TolC family protein [Pseudomonadota bacterium]
MNDLGKSSSSKTHCFKLLLPASLLALAISTFTCNESFAQVDFDTAVSLYIESQVETSNADIQIESAKDASFAAKQNFLPTIHGSASIAKESIKDQNAEQLAATGSLNLFRFGADKANLNFANASLESALQKKETNRASKSWVATKTLLQYLHAIQNQRVINNYLAIKNRSLSLTQKLYQNGTKPAQDVEKISLDLLAEESRAQEANLDLKKRDGELKIYLKSQQIADVWPWIKLVQNLSKDTQSSWKERFNDDLKSALDPELKLLSLQLTELESKKTIARTSLFPTVDLEATHQWNKNSTDKIWERYWLAELKIRIPIFQGGTNYYQIHETERNVQKIQIAKADLEKRSNQLKLIAIEELETSVKNYQIKTTLTQRSQKLFEQSLSAYGRGLLSVNDLLTDQSRVIQAEREELGGILNSHLALLQYCEAKGQNTTDCILSIK